jgi:DNA-binding GntR family transcriptional regulator
MMATTPSTSADEIYEAVREWILSGVLPAPTPVRQDALARALGISKIPLREALARLEQDGLLASARNRGFFVRPLAAAEAEEIYALRLKIEPELVAAAAARATSEEQAAATAALEALEREIEAQGARAGVLNRRFHLAMAQPADRPLTLQMLERLHVLSERYVRKHLEPPGRDEHAFREHRMLLALWMTRDADEIARATAAHIRATLEDLRRQLSPAR